MTRNFDKMQEAIEVIKKIYSFDDDFIIKHDLDFILWYWEDKEFNFNLRCFNLFLACRRA